MRQWPYTRRLTTTICAIVYAVVVALSMVNYQFNAVESVKQNTYESLLEVSACRSALLYTKMDGLYSMLEVMASALPENVSASVLKTGTSEDGFLHVSFSDADGHARSDNNMFFDVSARDYFYASMRGERALEKVKSLVDGEIRYTLSVPVYDAEGDIAGVLFGGMNTDAFSHLMEDGRWFLCDEDGALMGRGNGAVFSGDEKDIWRVFGDENIFSGEKNIAGALREGSSGTVGYAVDGARHYASYTPLGVNGWMFFTVVDAEQTDARAAAFMRHAVLMTAQLMGSFVLLMGVVLLREHVRTRQRNADYQALLLGEDKYRVTRDMSDAVLFDIDLSKRVIAFNRNYELVFGTMPFVRSMTDLRQTPSSIYEPDAAEFEALCADILAGVPRMMAQYRVVRADGSLSRRRVECVTLFGEDRKPAYVMGKLVDMDAQGRALPDDHDVDEATRLYTRAAFARETDGYLDYAGQEGRHALLVVDLSQGDTDEKKIGDAAMRLARYFRATDIMGRVGEKELAVLMKDAATGGAAESRAREIDADFMADAACVRMAVYPDDGLRYDELYWKAAALSKDAGRAKHGG